jgi:hypothetical protein
MNHKEAVDLQAAAKYVLGELSPAERDDYEDHYIDCPECAKDVNAAAAFADTTREVFRQEERAGAEKTRDRARGGWFAWLKPVVAVPAFAVLLLVVAYQNTVTIPRAKQQATEGAAQLFTTSFSLQMANVRGGEEAKAQVRPNEAFALDFDFTPTRSFASYVCQLQDESGRSVLQMSLPGTRANKEVHLAVPGGLVHPGKYSLVFMGVPGANGQGTGEEVLRLRFTVEFLQ